MAHLKHMSLVWFLVAIEICCADESTILDKCDLSSDCSGKGAELESTSHKSDSCACNKLKRDKADTHENHFHHGPNVYARSAYEKLEDMVLIDDQEFLMGTSKPVLRGDGEGPQRPVSISRFYIDVHEVSNAKFKTFVDASGHKTEAETFGNSFVLESLVKNAELKASIKQAVAAAPWWLPVNGSYWAAPEGPGSDISERMDHPVVHVSWNDAVKYCEWRGKRLPTEAEWEAVCKSGLKDRLYSWGNKWQPNGEFYANVWQGAFPEKDEGKAPLSLVGLISSIINENTN